MLFWFVALMLLFLLPTLLGGWESEARRRRERIRPAPGPRRPPYRPGGYEVALEVGGVPALLYVREEEPFSVLTLEAEDRRRKPLSVFESIPGKPMKGRDIQIGHPAFDRAWIVQGDDARSVFAPEGRAELAAAVDALRRFPRPRVSAGPEGLRIRVAKAVRTEEDTRVLLQAAEALAAALKLRGSQELLWIETRNDAPAVCQVCGTEILGSCVYCRSCRTAHHEECWSYAGRCSTFGCGQARFARD